MLKRFRHILILVFLLSGALKALAQIAMPDTICVGTIRHYWVNGTAGSIYTWKIDGVTQSSAADNIDITWPNTGTFTLTVQEHQNGCDGDVQSGQVIVNLEITPTFAAVGPYCPGAIIPALPTTSANGITGTWSPAINNMASTIYTFTPAANQCAVPTTLSITIEDIIKPSFTLPTLAAGYCPADIFQAIVDPNPTDPELDLTFHRPDYYIFGVGFTILDLDLSMITDNCSLAANPISWTIDFGNDGSIDLSGTNQLSLYGTVIHFPVGDNKVSYTVTDAAGNVSLPQFVILKVTPRPVMTKIP